MIERQSTEHRLTRRRALLAGIGLLAGAAGRPAAVAACAFQAATDLVDSGLLVEPASLLVAEPGGDRALRQMVMPGGGPVLVALASEDDHASGRLPGAARIDWPELEVIDTSEESLARWREAIEQAIAALGIAPERDVVTYDPGTLFAARLWWVLTYLGHDRVSVLHGGLAGWEAAGGEIVRDNGSSAPAPASEPYRSAPRPEVLARWDQVRDALGDPAVMIVDARTPEEYAAGHIPGAVNVNYVRNAGAEPPRRWLPVAELRAMYEAIAVTPEKVVIPYCSSGVRSAVTVFTLKLLGYPNVALYTGSWQEWGARSDLPVITGDQP